MPTPPASGTRLLNTSARLPRRLPLDVKALGFTCETPDGPDLDMRDPEPLRNVPLLDLLMMAFSVADGDYASAVLAAAIDDKAIIESAERDTYAPPTEATIERARIRMERRMEIALELHRRGRESLLAALGGGA